MTGKFFNKKIRSKMKQIFYFQFSNEVYVRLRCRLIRAAKLHILSYRYDTNRFPVTRFSHVRRKSLNLLKFHISVNNLNKYILNHTQD